MAVLVGLGQLALGGCTSRPPQVVLITIDALRADHVGPRASLPSLTPGLDRLAADAVRYDDALANCTMTVPSHLAMLTGRYPPRHAAPDARGRLGPRLATLPGLLRVHGFRTGAVVSSIVLTASATGLGDAFDLYDETFSRSERNRRDFLVKSPRQAVRVATRWALSHQREPFFLWLHVFPPHGPYDPPERFLDGAVPVPREEPHELPLVPRNYQRGSIPAYQQLDGESDPAVYRKRYAANVRYADFHVGQFLEALRQAGIYRRALIVVTADHGESLGEHDWYFCHGNLVYGEQAHVPLLVKLPGNRFGGSKVDAPVELADLMPTVLAAEGVTPPERLDGRKLPVPGEKPSARERFVQSEGAEIIALLDGPWKLTLRKSESRFVPADHPALELFRLDRDPTESINLAGQDPRIVEEMRGRLARLSSGAAGRQTAVDPLLEEKLRALGYVE